MHAYALHECLVPMEGQMWDPLALELQMFMLVLGIEPRSCGRAVRALFSSP